LYGLAAVSASIYVALVAVIFYDTIFYDQPTLTTLESAARFPEIEPGFEEILIITVPGILTATTFLSLWGGTIIILYSNIKRVGRVKFWILVTTPIIFFLGTLYREKHTQPYPAFYFIISLEFYFADGIHYHWSSHKVPEVSHLLQKKRVEPVSSTCNQKF
jgi:hypothetical protein